ncbi:filamentous hemagglutinin outer membrane protein [Calothrix parasitica NIES-267]|uniref:Filamentous hemagglutinin outer membrane protein n=1 Tax=Calothrix parasitica NIES-267 TaxID=1973488 RepID=A0A1Z4LSX4_9CYAN|nr:filamentous hemagglutinin outer membrane protein [Calothrix parasitica NIES-267]
MKGIFWLGILGITSLQILSASLCLAQSSNIITDDSLGNEASQIEKNGQLKGLPVEIIRGGAQRGINLFHSFREFNVREGRGAYFFSPNAEIQNILTRVTGSKRSEILGTLDISENNQSPTITTFRIAIAESQR